MTNRLFTTTSSSDLGYDLIDSIITGLEPSVKVVSRIESKKDGVEEANILSAVSTIVADNTGS
jgi:hypothetical protein